MYLMSCPSIVFRQPSIHKCPFVCQQMKCRHSDGEVPFGLITAGSEEVNSLLQPLLNIVFNLKKLPTRVLVQLQQVMSQELADRKKQLSDGYM